MRSFATDTINTQGPRGFLASLAAAASQPLSDTVTLTWLVDGHVTRVHCVALPCDWVELLEACIGNAGQAGCEQVIVTVHASKGDTKPYEAEVADLRTMVEPCGMDLLDALLVDGNRFWSYLCTDDTCCPPEGSEVIMDASEVPPPALQPVTAEQFAQADELLGTDMARRAQAAWQALTDLQEGSTDPSHDTAVLGAAMQEIDVRDFVLVKVRTSEALEGPLARTLAAVAHALPEGPQQRVAAAAAMVLLASGSHPQPVRDLLAVSGEESLARLVTRALEAGVPPRVAAESLDAVSTQCIEAVTSPAA